METGAAAAHARSPLPRRSAGALPVHAPECADPVLAVAYEVAAGYCEYRIAAPQMLTEQQRHGHDAIETRDAPVSIEYGPRERADRVHAQHVAAEIAVAARKTLPQIWERYLQERTP